MDQATAEAIAGPFFAASLFPYLAFLYFLSKKPSADTTNQQQQQQPPIHCPPAVVVGFAACLVFVFLTIPAAIAAKLLYGVSLADADWLHGSAESTLTVANLALVIAFRSAVIERRHQPQLQINNDTDGEQQDAEDTKRNVIIGCSLAVLTAFAPIVTTYISSDASSFVPDIHSPYLGGFLDLSDYLRLPIINEPTNALTIATWIIHISSVVEFLVAMGFAWEWAILTNIYEYKTLTLALVPLHSSGITACVSHVFYNQIYMLVPLQALLTCAGNTTAAYAAWRISLAISSPRQTENGNLGAVAEKEALADADSAMAPSEINNDNDSSSPLVGFEDLGEILRQDSNAFFLTKLLIGTAAASYAVKYGGALLLPIVQLETNPYAAELALSCILLPSILNAYKWYQRGLQEQ